MNLKKLLRPAVGILISAIFLGLLIRTLDIQDVWASLRQANPIFFIPAIALYFAGTAVRSLRWQKLLPDHHVPFGDLFRSLVIGLTVNDVLPGRLGEIARVYLVSRHGVPVGTSLAAILVERVLDGLALTALVAGGIVLSGATGWMLNLAAASAAVFSCATLVLLWAAFVPGPARWVGLHVVGLAPHGWRERLERALDTGLDGLRGIAAPAAAIQVLGLSLIAWTLEASMYRVVMYGFHVPGGMAASIMGTGVANLATLIPGSPGHVGTFDAALTWVLVDSFGSPSSEAGAFTLTVHVLLIVPVVLLGLLFLWRENISLPELTRRPRSARSDEREGRPSRGDRDDDERDTMSTTGPSREAIAGPQKPLL